MINDADAGSDPIRVLAARNNAEWCAAVCRAYGLDTSLGGQVWTSARRTPPLYPDAVTLDPRATADALVAGIDTAAPGCSVKDSFACLDLTGHGFDVLFEAQWIHRPAETPPATAAADALGARAWRQVRTAAELTAWEVAWADGESTGLFRPELLSEEDIAFLYAEEQGRIVAGAVANRSAGAVGLSNVFGDRAWSFAPAAAATLWPGLPLVGYESGEDLDTAVRHGFAPAGPLRIWLHTA
ncbi:hypothetical protein [Streptomyces sp. NPDC051211]|uniref:hypothetical protein n=1 Tax=Streptomyces sp. NPDC051211 TaxID=3154643 RepID=UPI003450C8AE